MEMVKMMMKKKQLSSHAMAEDIKVVNDNDANNTI